MTAFVIQCKWIYTIYLARPFLMEIKLFPYFFLFANKLFYNSLGHTSFDYIQVHLPDKYLEMEFLNHIVCIF